MIVDRSTMLYRKALPPFVMTMIVPMDLVSDAILALMPRNYLWYVAGAIIACVYLLGILYLFRRDKIAALFDIFAFDILIMIIGGLMVYNQFNPKEPWPIPFQVMAVASILTKMYCAMYFLNTPGLVIGPFSYFQQKSLRIPRADPSRFLMGAIGMVFVAFVLLYYVGQFGTVSLRALFGVLWLIVALNYLNEHRTVQREYQDSIEEQQFLMIRLAELEHQLQDQQQLLEDEEELKRYFNDADPAYRKLALKLLRANYERNEEQKRQEELKAKGVFTMQNYSKANNDHHWQSQDGAKA